MQALSLASGFKLVRINTPKDAVNALNNAEFQKEAMAERDARWIFALIAMGFVVVGWFWQNIQHFLVKRRWLKTKQKV